MVKHLEIASVSALNHWKPVRVAPSIQQFYKGENHELKKMSFNAYFDPPVNYPPPYSQQQTQCRNSKATTLSHKVRSS